MTDESIRTPGFFAMGAGVLTGIRVCTATPAGSDR